MTPLAAIAAIRAVALGAAALVLHAGGSTTVVYALAIVATIAFNVFRPAHSALLPALCTSTHELTSANVVRGVLDAGGALVGPALAGVLLAVGSATTVFAAGALLCLGAVGVLVRIRYEAPAAPHAAARKALVCDAVEGVRAAAGHRDLRLIFGLGFAQTFVRGALNVLAIAVAFEVLGTDDPGVATLWVAVGAGGVVGSFAVSLLVGSRHLGAWLGVALVLWGLPIALIGAVPQEALALAMLAVLSRRPLVAMDRRVGVRDDEVAFLRRVPMLSQLPVPSIEHLASRLRRLTVGAGRKVFEQGDAGDGFYVMTAGQAEVVGDRAVVKTLGPGEAFGEIALLRGVPRTATLRATTDLDLVVLDRDVFLDAVCGYTVSAEAAEAVVARHLATFRPVWAAA